MGEWLVWGLVLEGEAGGGGKGGRIHTGDLDGVPAGEKRWREESYSCIGHQKKKNVRGGGGAEEAKKESLALSAALSPIVSSSGRFMGKKGETSVHRMGYRGTLYDRKRGGRGRQHFIVAGRRGSYEKSQNHKTFEKCGAGTLVMQVVGTLAKQDLWGDSKRKEFE